MAPKPNRVALEVSDSPRKESPPAPAAEADAEECVILAIPAKQSRAHTWRKRIASVIGNRDLEDVVEEVKKRRQTVEQDIALASENEQGKIQAAEQAEAEFQSASDEVDVGITKELEAARAYAELAKTRKEKSRAVERARHELYEAQKKLSTLEVLAVQHAKMKTIEATRMEARRAAEEAKKVMVENKKQQKEAANAMRRAMAIGNIIDLDPVQHDLEEKVNGEQVLTEAPAMADLTSEAETVGNIVREDADMSQKASGDVNNPAMADLTSEKDCDLEPMDADMSQKETGDVSNGGDLIIQADCNAE